MHMGSKRVTISLRIAPHWLAHQLITLDISQSIRIRATRMDQMITRQLCRRADGALRGRATESFKTAALRFHYQTTEQSAKTSHCSQHHHRHHVMIIPPAGTTVTAQCMTATGMSPETDVLLSEMGMRTLAPQPNKPAVVVVAVWTPLMALALIPCHHHHQLIGLFHHHQEDLQPRNRMDQTRDLARALAQQMMIVKTWLGGMTVTALLMIAGGIQRTIVVSRTGLATQILA